MAQLDMSDVIEDIDLGDPFIVERMPERIDAHGRSAPQTATLLPAFGTVGAANPNDLERLSDLQRMTRNISIVTKLRLQGPSEGVQPDVVRWQGNRFVVHVVEPYTQDGAGFVQAIAGSISTLDTPPTP